MFTSSAFAPPRTCSSATSTAPTEVAGLDQAPEARRARHVRPLADQDEARVRADLERLEPAPARRVRGTGGTGRGARLAHRAGDRRGVLGVEPQQLPATFRKPGLGELAQQAARDLGRLVVAAERVREARVRVGADEARRDARELGDVRPHLVRAERCS